MEYLIKKKGTIDPIIYVDEENSINFMDKNFHSYKEELECDIINIEIVREWYNPDFVILCSDGNIYQKKIRTNAFNLKKIKSDKRCLKIIHNEDKLYVITEDYLIHAMRYILEKDEYELDESFSNINLLEYFEEHEINDIRIYKSLNIISTNKKCVKLYETPCEGVFEEHILPTNDAYMWFFTHDYSNGGKLNNTNLIIINNNVITVYHFEKDNIKLEKKWDVYHYFCGAIKLYNCKEYILIKDLKELLLIHITHGIIIELTTIDKDLIDNVEQIISFYHCGEDFFCTNIERGITYNIRIEYLNRSNDYVKKYYYIGSSEIKIVDSITYKINNDIKCMLPKSRAVRYTIYKLYVLGVPWLRGSSIRYSSHVYVESVW